MIGPTPILDCKDHLAIRMTMSAEPSHPLQCPTFDIPPSIMRHIETASQHLHASRTVAFPTETVYGLGASSLDPAAVMKIYTIKNRPVDNPLIMHVSSLDMLHRILPPRNKYKMSKLYLALIKAFWPGPLTLLFPSPNPPPPPAPQTNGIRMPAHTLALALIHHSNLPLSAPSANSSGRPSPTKAKHVYHDLNGAEALGCILDAGDCGVGVESTVVDGLGWKEGGGGSVSILRPGGLSVEEIAKTIAEVDGKEGVTQILFHGELWRPIAKASSSKYGSSAVRRDLSRLSDSHPVTPGMKYRHYAPHVPVYMLLPSSTFPRPAALASSEGPTFPAVLKDIELRMQRNDRRLRFGLLHYEDSPLSKRVFAHCVGDLESVSLGDCVESAAQRLFAGLLHLEGSVSSSSEDCIEGAGAVDLIMVEGCSEEGLGLAVMERIGKAVDGGGTGTSLNGHFAEGQGQGGKYWVQV